MMFDDSLSTLQNTILCTNLLKGNNDNKTSSSFLFYREADQLRFLPLSPSLILRSFPLLRSSEFVMTDRTDPILKHERS